jgi:HEPN domain-containing protein
MDNYEKARQWRDIADKDLGLAEHVAKTMWPTPYELVCFHCQQAVEKYLKGFLVLNDTIPPKTHDLIELIKLCEMIYPLFSTIAEYCTSLTEYGVQSRYPIDFQLEITKEDMLSALESVHSVKTFIRENIPKLFLQDD